MRIGYVGLGWATRAFHLPAVKRIPGAVPVGGADTSEQQRSSFARDTGLPAFATLDELIDRAQPDVVVVATPPSSHAELCLHALEAGTHVLCEKPFVETLEQADAVIAAAARAARHVAVNHEYREMPIFKALAERIGADGVGRLVFCQVWQLMDLTPWEEPVPWRAAMPNRTLFEGGVHAVDLLLNFVGEKPTAVYACQSSGLESERNADAIHVVTLEFSNGRLAQLTIDRLYKAGMKYLDVRIDCEHASLRASHGGRALVQVGKKRGERAGIRLELAAGGLAWEERGLKRKTIARAPRNPGPDATRRLTSQILSAIREDREPPSNAREARDVLEVIEAAYRSAATGERVALSSRPSARAAAG